MRGVGGFVVVGGGSRFVVGVVGGGDHGGGVSMVLTRWRVRGGASRRSYPVALGGRGRGGRGGT